MKAIITGVTGQDGSHMADLLLSKGYDVIGVARRTSGDNTSRLANILNNVHFKLIEGDISDSHSMTKILSDNADTNEFYNFAAQSHVGTSFEQPSLTFEVTGKAVINILQTIVDLKLFHMKFYQASSSEMFGKNFDCDEKGVKYQDENTQFVPQSPYAIAKLSAHHAVRLYRQSHNLHASCGILFNHEGPRRGSEFVTRKITLWIGRYLKWLRDNKIEPRDVLKTAKEVLIHPDTKTTFPKLRLGNLDAVRDWGYSPDYMHAAWLMLQQETADDYVICTGISKSVREFISVAFEITGLVQNNHSSYTDLIYIDPKFYRPCEVDYLQGRFDKAKEKLNWTPNHTFVDLVHKMVYNDTKLR